MKKLINNIAWWLVKITCSHKNKKEKYICYQDDYIKYKCKDCKEFIYEEL